MEDPKSKLKYDMDICAKIALKEKNITEQCYQKFKKCILLSNHPEVLLPCFLILLSFISLTSVFPSNEQNNC